MGQPIAPGFERVHLIYAEAIGSFLVLLVLSQQQGFFRRHGVEVQCTAVRGATVPRLTGNIPIGLIGEPAAILQAAEGVDLRIVASLSRAELSGHLVARPEIKSPVDLRGKLIGVRVLGAGVWILTILALEQLGLTPQRDGIRTVPTGSPGEIVRALENGAIDAALVSPVESQRLKARGYSVLLQECPKGIATYGGALAVAADFLAARPHTVQNLIAALTEARAFSFAEQNKTAVMRAFEASLNITDVQTIADNLGELRRKPYPSRDALRKMQTVMAAHDLRAIDVNIDTLVEDRLVRNLDENGTIETLYAGWGVARGV